MISSGKNSHSLSRKSGSDLPPRAPEVWLDRIERDRPASIPEDGTMRGQAERWLAGQEVKVRAGAIAPGTLRNNTDCLAHFRNFLGDISPVSNIDEDRLEAYYLHLIGRLRDLSRDYALKCFGTAKAFIRYLVEKNMIPFPKNFESPHFASMWEPRRSRR